MKSKLMLALVLITFYSYSQCLISQFSAQFKGNNIATTGNVIFNGMFFFNNEGNMLPININSNYGTPGDLEAGPANRFYLLDQNNSDIKILDNNGSVFRKISLAGALSGLGVDASGKVITGTLRGSQNIIRTFNPFCNSPNSCMEREFYIQEPPKDIEVGQSGDIYILCNSKIYIYSNFGVLRKTLPLLWPFNFYAFEVDEKNERLYLTSPKEFTGTLSLISVYNLNGELQDQINGNSFDNFYGLASSDDKLLIANISAQGSNISVYSKTTTPPKIINYQPSQDPLMLCTGSSTILAISATGTNVNYQWKKDGIEIPSANKSDYCINNAQKIDSGQYECVIYNNCGTPISKAFNVKVNEPLSSVNPFAAYIYPLDQTKFYSTANSSDGVTVWLDYSSFTEVIRTKTNGEFVLKQGDYTGTSFLVYSYMPGCDYYITQNFTIQNEGRIGLRQEDLKFYPNPVKDNLFIEGPTGEGELAFYNSAGNQILYAHLLFPAKVNLSTLPEGLYVVRVIFKNEVLISKIRVGK